MTFLVLPGLKSSNPSLKWKVLFLLSLTTITFIFYTFPFISDPPHRQKAKIIFMNKDLCVPSVPWNKNKKTAVIVVLSSRHNFDRRNLVRQTYGSVRSANNIQILAVVFILANSTGSDDETNKLQAESNQFGDIIMGDFVDSYRNLTLKTIMAYDWLTTYCRHAQLVVKTDDDVVVNIYELTRQLDLLSPIDMVSSNIWCRLHQNEGTIKDKNSRFYASPVDFPTGKFPDHCAGLGYVTTFGVVERILDDIFRSYLGRVCTHEDVFMTGIVPIHINSNATDSWRRCDPIKLVDKWQRYSYAFENGGDDRDHFLRNFVKNATMDKEIENFNTFRKRYNERIFFLISHTAELEGTYRRLWEIIKKTFSN